ncbi:MAG: hypothetical protein IJF43_05160 [Firmicutes bacterium]|nr:hypothetical protein [Bacillota bacterium]
MVIVEELDLGWYDFDEFMDDIGYESDMDFSYVVLGDWVDVYKAVSYDGDMVLTTYITYDGYDAYMVMFGAVDSSWQDEDLFDDIISSADVYDM